MSAKPEQILLAWIGLTDLRASKGYTSMGNGPIAQAVSERRFSQIVLLSDASKSENIGFAKWLGEYTEAPIDVHHVKLTGPTNFGEIYEVVTDKIVQLHTEYGSDAKLTYHLSPGTPAMAAVWIIVAKTRYAAELIESSYEHGVKTATVPFDISAEFIPELYKRPDTDLERLTAGIPELAPAFNNIIHQSQAMKRVVNKAQRIAPRSIPVLIEGESGTGKELMARAIHEASTRRGKPFIAVNCGAIAADIVESEFFGHKKGAFTGATIDRKGHFETADGGTLFLDEVGELPLEMQVKFLRALQEKKITRLGTSDEIPVDVRIIAATNRTLSKEVAEGRFREDLFYRIAVGVIHLPPLRARSGDLGLLIDYLLNVINKESAAEPDWKEKVLSVNGRNLLFKHSWTGNIRELQNTLTRAAVWSGGTTISKDDIQEALFEIPSKGEGGDKILNQPVIDGIDLQGIISEVARHYINRTLKETGGNKSKAAELLGLGSYQTLKNWITKYGLD